VSTVSKEMLERMRSALAFDLEHSPGGAMPNLISIKREALEALIATAEGFVAYEAWAKARIAECREVVFRDRSNVVSHFLAEVEEQSRRYALIELRQLNFSLRILHGISPQYGCGKCTRDDTCYDGSVACQKQATK
jgi:hypothetical protein